MIPPLIAEDAALEPVPDARRLMYLVHGTFAEGAKWTLEGSDFRRWLERGLKARGANDVRFIAIPWGGENSHRSRRRGSVCLAWAIRAELRDNGPARVYLIGHSHGGNVAVRTARVLGASRAHLAGVVTLATPFLIFDAAVPLAALANASIMHSARLARQVARYWLVVSALGLLGYTVLRPVLEIRSSLMGWVQDLGAGGCRRLLGPEACEATWAGWTSLVAVLVSLVLLAVLLSIGWSEAQAGDRLELERVRSRSRRYGYAQPSSKLADVPILALSASGDEALQILDGSRWLHRTGVWFVRLVAAASVLVLLSGLLAVMTLLIGVEQTFRFSDQLLLVGLLIGGAGAVALPLALTAAGAIAALAQGWSSLPAPGLGLPAGAVNLVWNVRADRTLPGHPRWRHRRYPLRLLRRRKLSGWMHSRVYQIEEAAADIAEWIVELERKAT